MKKALLMCLLVLTFTTAFAVYESIDLTSGEEVSTSYGEYGPFRHFMQRHKQQRQLRNQRRRKVEIIIGADGQQYQRIIEVEGDE